MKKYLALFVFATLLSCKKDPINTTRELLSKSWIMTSWTIMAPVQGTPLEGIVSNNTYAAGSGCYYNMIWKFQNDGKFLHEPGDSCEPGTETLRGIWKLNETNKKISVQYIRGGFADFEFEIILLTLEKMVVQRIERIATDQLQGTEVLIQYEFRPK